jgi:hypothetical protein
MSLLNKQVFAPASKNELFVNCHNGKFATFSIQSKDFDHLFFFGFDESLSPKGHKNFPFSAENHRVKNYEFTRF